MSVKEWLDRFGGRWLEADGNESDIVMSSRVRVARNLEDMAFPMLLPERDQAALRERVEQTAQGARAQAVTAFEVLRMAELSPIQKQVLVEGHLISPALTDSAGGAVLVGADKQVSVLVNEEDHLRIQCLLPGFDLESARKLTEAVDDAFEQELDFAFDERLGYLTACPTNVGTGMRASVMLHLPALVLTGQIGRILSAVAHVGLTVRGIYGEGSDALGNLFQVSNQMTLGHSEEEIVAHLQGVVRQLIEQERAARAHIMQHDAVSLEDRVCRSFGILAFARQIDSREALSRLSDVRLGIDMDIIKGVSPGALKQLLVATQPGFLQTHYGQEMSPAMRDVHRASLIRERLRTDGQPGGRTRGDGHVV
ncbi:MAG: protein arginine kinase [Firmicutes bacterium]|nr:protein arginine kinase [Bacillota bacterium]